MQCNITAIDPSPPARVSVCTAVCESVRTLALCMEASRCNFGRIFNSSSLDLRSSSAAASPHRGLAFFLSVLLVRELILQ